MKTGDIVPCSKCPQCRKRRASAWAFRLRQEEKRSISSYFITLTYAPEFLPRTRNNFRTLNPSDLQSFFKKLRIYHDRRVKEARSKKQPYSYFLPLKYYSVGEYGGKFKRPHYHVIIFNADVELIEKAWPKGLIHYGKVEGASVNYCLKYISDVAWRPKHINDDRVAQFSRMSKNLGDNYLSRKMCKWHYNKLTERCYVQMDGKKMAMPRYYKLKMYTQGERRYIGETISNKLLLKSKVYAIKEVLESNAAQYRRHEYRSKLNQSI